MLDEELEVIEPTVETPAEETPSEETTEPTEEVAEQTEEEAPSEPEVESEPEAPLYELPDGRKVDAETLSKEWKENFLPDYTRKSQKLAEIEKEPIKTKEESVPYWADPEWVPETGQELLDAAVAKMKAEQAAEREAEEARRTHVEQMVDAEVAEIKQLDPNVNENLVFQHAAKYGFPSLKSAYQNMKDMQLAVKGTEKKTVQNIQKRAADPVATKPSVPADGTDTYEDLSGKSMFQIAQEALSQMKGK